MSATASMAGMFKPSTKQIWKQNLQWIPIPVHSKPHDEDFTLATYKRCDRFQYAMMNYIKTDEYRELFKNYKQLIEYLERHSGKKLRALVDINDLYDTLIIEQRKGMR